MLYIYNMYKYMLYIYIYKHMFNIHIHISRWNLSTGYYTKYAQNKQFKSPEQC